MAIIDKAVNDFLQKKLATTKADENPIGPLPINLFFLNQISAQYKQDEKQLTQIINRNVRAADNNGKVKLNIYYTNKNIRNLLIKFNIHNRPTNIENLHHVIYQYFCKRTDVRPLLLILVIRRARSKTDLKCILKAAVPSKNTLLLAIISLKSLLLSSSLTSK